MRDVPEPGVRVLVADDDEAMRFLLVTVLQATDGVASVVEAADGAEAVEAGRTQLLDVAVLDLQMPRLDGVEAAGRLLELQPWLQIAIASADTWRLHACGAGLPLFDKLRIERLFDWIETRASSTGAARPAATLRSR